MARRSNTQDDWTPLVAPAALVELPPLIPPQAQQFISAIVFIVFCLLGLAIVVLISLVVYRAKTRSRRSASTDNFVLPSITQANEPPITIPRIGVPDQPEITAPQTTAELLEQLRSIDWFQFEKLVAFVYRKLGYTVTRRGGANPDGGIDLLIEKDGQPSAVQCKQWKTWNVGVKAVREFLGALTHAGLSKGIFITLRGYTGDARQLADKHGIEIVNETGLAHLLQSTAAHSDPEVLALLRDTRKFCPRCERQMVLQTATKGRGAGKQFWGCSAFPSCRFTMPKD